MKEMEWVLCFIWAFLEILQDLQVFIAISCIGPKAWSIVQLQTFPQPVYRMAVIIASLYLQDSSAG